MYSRRSSLSLILHNISVDVDIRLKVFKKRQKVQTADITNNHAVRKPEIITIITSGGTRTKGPQLPSPKDMQQHSPSFPSSPVKVL